MTNAFNNEGITTLRTINNIKKTLQYSLKQKYNIEDENVAEEILKVHGLSKDNFDFIKNLETTILAPKLNDVSVDDNSNKEGQSIESIFGEITNPIKKAVGYDLLYRQLKENYGKEEAKRLTGTMYDFTLGFADSTHTLKVYCYAIDASKLVLVGRDFGQLHSGPAKRLSSYIAALNETIHQFASILAGAVAVGSFFLDTAHLLKYKENMSFEDLSKEENIKYIENCFQNFVHSVNHLSRNSAESPFSNVSVFDRNKLNLFLQPENMGWYFSSGTVEENIEYIMKIQEIFIEFFNKGDPLRNGLPYRFPIVTINFSKAKNADDKYEIVDNKLFNYMAEKDIYRYNIFASNGSKISSCCRLLNDVELLELAGQVNSFGGSGISLGSHRVVTINFNRIALESKSLTNFFELLNDRIDDTAKILASHKDLIRKMEQKGFQQFISNGWINMKRLFSTFGILGLYECVKTLLNKFDISSDDLTKDILITLNKKVNECSKKYKIIGNIEQIPGEAFAVRLAKTDNILYGTDYTLYSNQFIPLWEDATLWEKLEADGKYNQLLTGGGIVHAQIGEKLNPLQIKKVINYAIKCGCEHFALNAVYSVCKNDHTTFGKNAVCSVCGSDISDYMTRVVGFFTKVSNWNQTRREWEFPRRTFVNV